MKRFVAMSTARKVTTIVALLGVLATVVFFAASALANGLATPSITVKPASPTNSTSASFTYTDSSTITKFQCQLDSGGWVDCGTVKTGSSKSYSGLAAGSHTFQVRAVYNSTTSSPCTYTWVIDRTAPTVTSINTAAANPTKASSVTWTVVFSESVTGVVAGNFATIQTGLTGSTAVTNVSGSGTTYTVTASTGTSGTGTLQLKLSAAGSIKDLAGNALGGTIPFLGQTYTIDRTAPTVVSIVLADPNPTNAPSVRWTVTFSESVTGVAASNFATIASGLSGATPVTTVTGSGTTYIVTATTGGGGSGTLQLKLSSAGSIKDLATNALGGTIPFLGQTYTIDHVVPTVVSINRASTNPTSAATVQWTVTFSESVTGVDATDFALVAGGGLGGSPAITTVTGSGTTYTVTASTGSGSGTLGLNLVDNDSITDAAGNKLGGTGTGNGNFTGQVYTVTAATGMPFTIAGNASNTLYPGSTSPINLVFTNPNNVAITVTTVTVTITGTSDNANCPAGANFSIGQQLTVSVVVPASSTKSLSDLLVPQSSWPTIAMTNTATNQNGCATKTVNLGYSGSAHS